MVYLIMKNLLPKSAANTIEQFRTVEGFTKHGHCAPASGQLRLGQFAMSRDQDDRQLVTSLGEFRLHSTAAAPGHAQIQNQALVISRHIAGKKLVGTGAGHRFPSTGADQHAGRGPYGGIIVDDVDSGGPDN